MKRFTVTGGFVLALVFLVLQFTACSVPKLDVGEAEVVHTFENDPPLYASPEGIAFDSQGNLFVSLRTFDGTSYVRNELIRISLKGEKTFVADLGSAEPGHHGAVGLTTDSAGNVYLALASGNAHHGVWKITPEGETEHLKGSENIEAPNSLIFDPQGNLYATDSKSRVKTREDPGSVWKYGVSGVFEIWASSVLLAPDPLADPLSPPPPAPPVSGPGANGIVFAPPNQLYVANTEKCLILEIPVLPDGSAGEVTVVAGAYPPDGPPGLLFAPDGLALDAEGFIYTVIPPAGLTGPDFPLSPVIRIDPSTGEVEAVVDPLVESSPMFDFPTSLAFGTGPWDHQSLFVVGITGRIYGFEGSGPKITQVRAR
jgi:sugar lactone lactonase YvrE